MKWNWTLANLMSAASQIGRQSAAATILDLGKGSGALFGIGFTYMGDRRIDLPFLVDEMGVARVERRINGVDHPIGRSGRYRSSITVPLMH
ncbi:MAG: hypothetical protein ACFE0I_19585 [Elainellaceae cyanobacterium]